MNGQRCCCPARRPAEEALLTTRYSRDTDIIAELAGEALSGPDLERLVLSGARPESRLVRTVIRPVLVRGQRMLALQCYDAEKCLTFNASSPAEPQVRELLSCFRHLTAQTSARRIDARVTKRGRTLVSVVEEGRAPDLRHDRHKHTLLSQDAPFLELLGMSSGGTVKPAQQRKWRQVDEFLRLLTGLPPVSKLISEEPLRIADLGCGNAYLTFAVYHYLTQTLGVSCQIIGVDRDGKAVVRGAQRSRALGWPGLTFLESSIAGARLPWSPHIVLALHACDTATDDAAARALEWGSEVAILAPCCHHDLQEQLRRTGRDGWAPVLRQGVLRERFGDVLTDALRTALLAASGYRTDVVQFVSPEHTAKNLMIRAWRDPALDRRRYRRDYEALRDEWHVQPRLEDLLRGPAGPPESRDSGGGGGG